jgi:Flp pilus assembly protein TadD
MAAARLQKLFAVICLILAFATAALYWPITSHPFILYDDQQYVVVNHHVTTGLNGPNLVWAFTNTEAANWHPLTWLSHQLDCALFSLHAGAHHLVNLLFHIANTLLLFRFLRRATSALWRPAFVAALFAWHPVHVESVAWVSERKDMLSTFFWLLTLLAWLRYARESPKSDAADSVRFAGTAAYLLALVFFVLGLLSKPMVVTLPFVLLLLDIWPLNRLADDVTRLVAWKGLILEKLPFFILAAAGCAVTYLAQAGGGAVWSTSLHERLANAVIAYARYVVKLFWPDHLAIVYSPPGHWPAMQVIGALVLLILGTVPILLYLRRCPYLFVGWFWFLGTLVPTIGLIQVGAQSMADRYTYIPSIGFFIVCVWGWAEFLQTHPRWKNISFSLFGAALIGCILATSIQIGYWRSNIDLCLHAMDVSPDSYVAANNLGKAFELNGDKVRALVMYRRAVELEPRFPQSQFNYALALFDYGQTNDAVSHLQAAARLESHDPEIQHALGMIFIQHNYFADAANCFTNVLSAQPASATDHFDLACTLANLGHFTAAAAQFREALRLNPDFPEAKTQFNHLLSDHPELR